MRFHIMTLFPEMMKTVLSESILGRAQKKGCFEIFYENFRDYSTNKHRNVDDTPFGGGMGMLLTVQPICDCHRKITSDIERISEKGADNKTRTIYMSPKGRLLDQQTAERLAEYDDIIIVCGHYEGIDERIIEEIIDEEISVGDFVLTGGELPCAILVDSVARLCEGVLKDAECHRKESISSGFLEYPQYTKPQEIYGRVVPEVLVSGHHAKIERWQREMSLKITMERRPDLICKNKDKLSKEDIKFLAEQGFNV